MAINRVKFMSWEEAFALVSQVDDLVLVTTEISGGRHWILASAEGRRLMRTGSTLDTLSEAVTDYFA